jgi:MoxR-like ATPase
VEDFAGARNPLTIDSLVEDFAREGYVLDQALATAIFLLIRLEKPLLVEGNAGVGKTEIAKTLARVLEREVIRLQCYEGLDLNSAVYEWNYQKQLLAIKIEESSGASVEQKEKHIFSPEFLLERPLLRSIRSEHSSPVLLIDEIDRSDEAFEAFLLELLSDFQITIPELGTIRAQHRPLVILTSNRTRELSDALKRRCLYHWIDYPDYEKELAIVRARVPSVGEELATQTVSFVQSTRRLDLAKSPGVAETLDCVAALMAMGKDRLDAVAALTAVAKSAEDAELIRAKVL